MQVMLAWQIRIGVSINPRSVSAQHMQDALDALKEAAFLYCYSKEPWAELDFS